jgi:hypothetical protein
MKVAWMVVTAALAGLGQESKSALEADPSGWVDVFPGKEFKGWKRLPLDPGAPLATKAVWSHSADGKSLYLSSDAQSEVLQLARLDLQHRASCGGVQRRRSAQQPVFRPALQTEESP